MSVKSPKPPRIWLSSGLLNILLVDDGVTNEKWSNHATVLHKGSLPSIRGEENSSILLLKRGDVRQRDPNKGELPSSNGEENNGNLPPRTGETILPLLKEDDQGEYQPKIKG